MIDKKNVFMYSILLSREYNPETITSEDIKNMLNEEVSVCQITLYKDIIKMLSDGKSYIEIFDYIDAYENIEYENLLEDQKSYIKTRVKRDLLKRKKSLKKGEDINE